MRYPVKRRETDLEELDLHTDYTGKLFVALSTLRQQPGLSFSLLHSKLLLHLG